MCRRGCARRGAEHFDELEASPGRTERLDVLLDLTGVTSLPDTQQLRAVADRIERVGYARSIPRWRKAGYRVTLCFLSLSSPEVAIERVAERVRQGGHDVPAAVIRRRFWTGRENFDKLSKPLVDEWAYYDNAGSEPVLLDKGRRT